MKLLLSLLSRTEQFFMEKTYHTFLHDASHQASWLPHSQFPALNIVHLLLKLLLQVLHIHILHYKLDSHMLEKNDRLSNSNIDTFEHIWHPGLIAHILKQEASCLSMILFILFVWEKYMKKYLRSFHAHLLSDNCVLLKSTIDIIELYILQYTCRHLWIRAIFL